MTKNDTTEIRTHAVWIASALTSQPRHGVNCSNASLVLHSYNGLLMN